MTYSFVRNLPNNRCVMNLATRFLHDEQVRAEFGDHAYATAEYVSSLTPHTTLANSLLLDPDHNSECTYSPLVVAETTLTQDAARKAAQEVRTEVLQPSAREKAECKYVIALPPEGDEPHSEVTIRVFEYSIPVAYKVVGRLKKSDDSDDTPKYLVRVVWEPHRFASVKGRILAVNGQMRKRDSMFVSAVQHFQGKKAQHEGDSLPIAEALAHIVMRNRTKHAHVPDDVRALLSSDEVGVEVDVIEVEERSRADQMMDVLQHSLRHMGLENSDGSATTSQTPPSTPRPQQPQQDGDGEEDHEDIPPLVREDT